MKVAALFEEMLWRKIEEIGECWRRAEKFGGGGFDVDLGLMISPYLCTVNQTKRRLAGGAFIINNIKVVLKDTT